MKTSSAFAILAALASSIIALPSEDTTPNVLPRGLAAVHQANTRLSARDIEKRDNCVAACLKTYTSFCMSQSCAGSADANCPICYAIHNHDYKS
ncbi:hypothetical protein B0H66DRAFT_607367 [Apodospora peruviana]|uniref:Uncharacterized protein n=1 Tax=Apodospora peruviana TaxID=516989 RepID=A0AAE0M088_9PEZI|nr:hypothetical protein B0H66DRAFT_607367 [Apodospora peruviana]